MNYESNYTNSDGGGCCSGCFPKAFYVVLFCFLLSECVDRCGCTNPSDTEPHATDSVPVSTDEDFKAYLDSIIAAQDTATDTIPAVESAATKPILAVPRATPTNVHTTAYEEGRQKGYSMGEEDAMVGGGYQVGYNDGNSYEGDDHDEYVRGYSNGYEDGYNDNYDEERDGES